MRLLRRLLIRLDHWRRFHPPDAQHVDVDEPHRKRAIAEAERMAWLERQSRIVRRRRSRDPRA